MKRNMKVATDHLSVTKQIWSNIWIFDTVGSKKFTWPKNNCVPQLPSSVYNKVIHLINNIFAIVNCKRVSSLMSEVSLPVKMCCIAPALAASLPQFVLHALIFLLMSEFCSCLLNSLQVDVT